MVGEKATSNGVDVTIRCSGVAGQSCSGRIPVITVETRQGSKVIAVASAALGKRKHRHVTVTVAGGSYALAVGQSRTVHVTLRRIGRTLLARFHKLPVKVTVTQAGERQPISTRNLTIRPARKRKRAGQ